MAAMYKFTYKKKKRVIAEKNGQSRIGFLPSEKQACTSWVESLGFGIYV